MTLATGSGLGLGHVPYVCELGFKFGPWRFLQLLATILLNGFWLMMDQNGKT